MTEGRPNPFVPLASLAIDVGYTVNGKNYHLPGGGQRANLHGLTDDEKEGWLISHGYKVVHHADVNSRNSKSADLPQKLRQKMKELGDVQRARDEREAPKFTEDEKRELRAIAEAARANEAEGDATVRGSE